MGHQKISDKKLYDVKFFQDYFKNKEVVASEGLENLQEQYHAFQEERDRIKYPLKRLRKPLRHLRKNEIPFVNLKWNLQRTK